MKTYILPAALLLLAGAAQAQTSAGTIMVGGGLGASSRTYETDFSSTAPDSEVKVSSFSFSPQVGYFLADNLAVGVFADLNNEKATRPVFDQRGVEYKVEETARRTQVGPFVRYYHMVGDEGKAGFYGQLAAGLQKSKDEYDTSRPNEYDESTELSGGFAAITPGFVFFPTRKFGLELTLGNLGFYSVKGETKTDNPFFQPYKTKESGVDANFGLRNLSIGAFFYLGSN
ncbi:hypothetical protein [Hymenobacter sp. B81]|uniref:hypothetical protein n=1 Tax=Hymenobacter sp. B81 TaxID=3344878 RepID=UPI0037DD9415